MVRQAKNYMVGAMSGAGLIAAAVVAFVLLVSALVFEDLPGLGLVDGSDEASISTAKPAAAGTSVAGAVSAPSAANAGAGAGAAKGDGPAGAGPPAQAPRASGVAVSR